MDFSGIKDGIISFSMDNPIIALVAGLLLLFLLVRKPKLVFGLLGLVLILTLAIYFIMDVASLGKTEKSKMIEKGVHPGTDPVH